MNASSSHGKDSPAHGPTSPCTTTLGRHASCHASSSHAAPMKKPSLPSLARPQSSNDGCARTPSTGPTTAPGPSCSSSRHAATPAEPTPDNTAAGQDTAAYNGAETGNHHCPTARTHGNSPTSLTRRRTGRPPARTHRRRHRRHPRQGNPRRRLRRQCTPPGPRLLQPARLNNAARPASIAPDNARHDNMTMTPYRDAETLRRYHDALAARDLLAVEISSAGLPTTAASDTHPTQISTTSSVTSKAISVADYDSSDLSPHLNSMPRRPS